MIAPHTRMVFVISMRLSTRPLTRDITISEAERRDWVTPIPARLNPISSQTGLMKIPIQLLMAP